MIVNRKTLHACSLFASRETSRPYLCGVHVEAGPWGMRYCATDGHALILLFDAEGKQDESESILFPAMLCKPPARGEATANATARADEKEVFLSLPDGCTLGTANPLWNTQYPEVERVIPANGSLSGKIAQFDPALLNLFAEFARRMMGKKAAVRPVVLHNGEEPAIVVFPPAGKDIREEERPGIENALGVVMPLRARGVPEAKEWVRPGWFEQAFPARAGEKV